MTTAFRFFRILQVMSLSVLLIAPSVWAQQSYRDTDDDTALTSQDFDTESDDDGRSFDRELADIERQYSELVPDSAKSTAFKDVTNGVDVPEDDEGEDQ